MMNDCNRMQLKTNLLKKVDKFINKSQKEKNTFMNNLHS
jgi:hypothetical protein